VGGRGWEDGKLYGGCFWWEFLGVMGGGFWGVFFVFTCVFLDLFRELWVLVVGFLVLGRGVGVLMGGGGFGRVGGFWGHFFEWVGCGWGWGL